jgi:PilZ domain
MAPANTRRWPRHQVKLPVRIITINDDVSQIAVPGLTTEISRGGMALYGGVSLQPGDLMEVEFQTPGLLRVAGAVRDRNGYCFGLEFATLLPGEEAEVATPDFQGTVSKQIGLAAPDSLPEALDLRRREEGLSRKMTVEVVPGADEIFALFLQRHEEYLEQKELEIKRMRQELREIRESRREIELLQRRFFGRSD